MSVTFKEYIKYPVESTHNNKFCQLEKFEKNWNFDFFFGGGDWMWFQGLLQSVQKYI